jgi:hypothetical protein
MRSEIDPSEKKQVLEGAGIRKVVSFPLRGILYHELKCQRGLPIIQENLLQTVLTER